MDTIGIPSIVYLLSCHVVSVTCLCMIYHKRYDDGLFGRVSLVIMLVACILIIMDFWFGELWWGAFTVNPTNAAFALGTAVFMLRHVLRFWKVRFRCDVVKGVNREVSNA